MPEDKLSIGELTQATGVSARSIRHWEQLGILPRAERTPGGTRRYGSEYVFFVEGVQAMRDMGFTLDELVALGRWSFDARRRKLPRATREMVAARVAALDHRINVLERVRTQVAAAVADGASSDEPLQLAFARASREERSAQ
ncbi:MAG: MerR family DNA-binding transcriptional regulator [Solirubrobacteraceae bacterium]|jgi:DNA-binding transcriptional MerR regulator